MAARRSTLRLGAVRLALWGLVLAAGLGASWLFLSGPAPTDTLGQGDYRLDTTTGATFTEASLRGQPSVVFFGYTHCPDVCPTTLGDILAWQEALGPEAAGLLRVWFVTVDPRRDTAGVLRDYLGWLPGAVGVTGNQADTDRALAAFRIHARKVPLEDGGYAMDHSAQVMLFDAKGRMRELIGYQEPHDRALARLRRVLADR